jgi:O-antigen/teichoic acid export membrane protein
LSNIRIRYSGLVLLASRFFSTVTGLLFTIMVTRRLSVVEFGIWQYITVLLGYFILPSSIASFWVTRGVARGSKVARLGILTNVLLSLMAAGLFSALAIPLSGGIGASILYFLLCAIQLPEIYVLNTLEAVASGTKPEVFGYSIIIFESAKVVVGLILVVLLRTGLTGAILAVVAAYFTQIVMMAFCVRVYMDGSLDRGTLRRWLSLFWIPTFNQVAIQLYFLDAIILTAVTGSTVPIAMLKAAQIFGTAILATGLLAAPLYPKLLGGGTPSDIDTALKMVLMFAIPSTLGVVLLSEPLLSILRLEYVQARFALIAIALASFLNSIGGALDAIIMGTERIDEFGNVAFGRFIRSRLALLPSLAFIQDAIYLTLLAITAPILYSMRVEPSIIVLDAAVIALLTALPIFLFKYRLAKRIMPFRFPLMALRRYAIAALAMAIALIVPSLSGFVVVSENILKVMSTLLPTIGAGAVVYFSVLTLIDNDMRNIVKAISKRLTR